VKEDEPLPGMPEPPVAPMRKVPPGLRAVRTRPTQLCERCCYLIHLRGQDGAPYPRAARWRVSSPSGVQRLCDTHKDERLHP
jgi:hypothetical protein